jgi:hypothetical protein
MKPISLALLRKHCLQHMRPYLRISPWGFPHTRLPNKRSTTQKFKSITSLLFPNEQILNPCTKSLLQGMNSKTDDHNNLTEIFMKSLHFNDSNQLNLPREKKKRVTVINPHDHKIIPYTNFFHF